MARHISELEYQCYLHLTGRSRRRRIAELLNLKRRAINLLGDYDGKKLQDIIRRCNEQIARVEAMSDTEVIMATNVDSILKGGE